MEHRESPVRVRRPALARIGLAGLAAALAIAALAASLDLASGWLRGRPAYRLPFRAIALDPPPPAWYRGGSEAFLDRVRDGDPARETLSVLDLDLGALALLFQRDCWVEKVVRVERSYPNRVVVRLKYHEPVAVVRIGDEGGGTGRGWVIDGEGTILRGEDIDAEAAGRLIEVFGPGPPHDPAPGKPWKATDAATGRVVRDGRVRAAARLAAFLKSALSRAGRGDKPPTLKIHVTDRSVLWVQYGPSTMILWGEPPGDEHPGPLSPEERWTRLRDWIEANPNPVVTGPYYLDVRFADTGPVVRKVRHP